MSDPVDLHRFITDGFVKIDGAFDRELGLQCQDELWRATGCLADDPDTWTRPLVRIPGMSSAPFTAAANTAVLHSAFDLLVGAGNWRPRMGLGSFPVRFPSTEPAPEAGWHVEASYAGADGTPMLNLTSRGRALLMLFLFSDIDEDDAPTLIRQGSHHAVPPVLRRFGSTGAPWFPLCAEVVPATTHHPVIAATGRIGDVYLCHPFVVHSGQAHRGARPRFMAQPPLEPTAELDLTAATPTPVAAAVLAGLTRSADGFD